MKQDILSMSRIKRYIVLCVRLVLAGLFLYAGVSKISQPYQFAAAIQAYQFLPESLVGLAAVLIPWLETVGAVALLLRFKPRSALLTFMVLLALFVFMIGLTMSRGLDIDCGCGLLASRRVGWIVLAEDISLFLVITWLYYMFLPHSSER
jgi:putative oxidoreductase